MYLFDMFTPTHPLLWQIGDPTSLAGKNKLYFVNWRGTRQPPSNYVPKSNTFFHERPLNPLFPLEITSTPLSVALPGRRRDPSREKSRGSSQADGGAMDPAGGEHRVRGSDLQRTVARARNHGRRPGEIRPRCGSDQAGLERVCPAPTAGWRTRKGVSAGHRAARHLPRWPVATNPARVSFSGSKPDRPDGISVYGNDNQAIDVYDAASYRLNPAKIYGADGIREDLVFHSSVSLSSIGKRRIG